MSNFIRNYSKSILTFILGFILSCCSVLYIQYHDTITTSKQHSTPIQQHQALSKLENTTNKVVKNISTLSKTVSDNNNNNIN